MRRRFVFALVIFQCVLFFGHWVVYQTLVRFLGPVDPFWASKLKVALAVLSITFVTATLLAYRYCHPIVRVYYTLAVTWLGTVSFCFLAALACWALNGVIRLLGLPVDRRVLGAVLFSLALLASLYGLINATRVRVRRITVKLPNLPDSWRGRMAALVSDTHLGAVRNGRFSRRIVALLSRLHPAVIFIGGDLYDGTAADLNRLAEPWSSLAAPLGTFFVTGNHEEFSGHAKYTRAIEQSGIRVLRNEAVIVDDLQIVGVHHHDSVNAQRFRSILQAACVDRSRASILLAHAPYHPAVVAREGISLQLSGHTHAGQFFPFTWISSQIYHQFAYGLNRLDGLVVYTSSGAGTWGPPMRVGTRPEVVMIQFE